MVTESFLKRLFLACALVCLMSASTFAQEDASGPYIGAHLGVGYSDNTLTDYDGGSGFGKDFKHDYQTTKPLYGFLAGYNWQFDNWVTGIEADASFGHLKAISEEFTTGYNEIVSTQINWFSTLRGRVGYAFDKVTPYITAGVAVADITNRLTDYDGVPPIILDPNDSYEKTVTKAGWVLGAGADFDITDSWGVRMEGLYMDFGRVKDETPAGYHYSHTNRLLSTRAALVYSF